MCEFVCLCVGLCLSESCSNCETLKKEMDNAEEDVEGEVLLSFIHP